MKLIRKNKKKGFTLVELIVVIAILAILALILIPAITGYVGKAEDSALEASARSLHTKAVMHVSEKGYTQAGLEGELNNELPEKYTVEVADGTEEGDYTVTVTLKDKNKFVEVDQDGNITEVEKTNSN